MPRFQAKPSGGILPETRPAGNSAPTRGNFLAGYAVGPLRQEAFQSACQKCYGFPRDW